MPAYSVSQLETILGSYVEPNGNFTAALAQVLPRVYSAGLWPDTVYEISLPADAGYVSLPADTDSVLACMIDEYPAPVRSLWSDLKIVGVQAQLSPMFGIVDGGHSPVMLDMKEVQEVDDEDDVEPVTDNFLAILDSGTSNDTASLAGGEIKITVALVDGGTRLLIQESEDAVTFTSENAFNRIVSIAYDSIPAAVDIVDSAFPTKVIATVPAGSGVLRFRRYRVSGDCIDSVVHLLLKRAAPVHLTEDTIIYNGNIPALKNALLCRIAEDNADIIRADWHWSKVIEILDSALDSYRGAAKPMLQLNVWGNAAPYNLL